MAMHMSLSSQPSPSQQPISAHDSWMPAHPCAVVARWSDGEPAATEAALGAGCVRSASVALPAAGDLALTPPFRRFAERMVAPCGSGRPLSPASDSTVAAMLTAEPATATSDVRLTAPAGDSRRTLVTMMLGLALAAALGEMFLRRGDAHAAA